jgi:SAM-dependent methyltransferase
LDVACGTGQSARALLEMSDRVDAIDNSQDMLDQAPCLEGVHYERAEAEELPFPDKSFNLISVGCAFHWFDQARFLGEAFRVLEPDGWLLIYNNVFVGEMRENPAFKKWAWDTYPKRYPTPPRNRIALTEEFVATNGFRLSGKEQFTNDVKFTQDELVRYLTTQSNVIAAVEQGNESIKDVCSWIDLGVGPFFASETGTFVFSSTVWYLKKRDAC